MTDANVYMVGIRWVSDPLRPPLERVDGSLGQLENWLRYNPHTWFARTDLGALHVAQVVQSVLDRQDSVLVIRADLSEVNGFAPQEVWDWLASMRSLAIAKDEDKATASY